MFRGIFLKEKCRVIYELSSVKIIRKDEGGRRERGRRMQEEKEEGGERAGRERRGRGTEKRKGGREGREREPSPRKEAGVGSDFHFCFKVYLIRTVAGQDTLAAPGAGSPARGAGERGAGPSGRAWRCGCGPGRSRPSACGARPSAARAAPGLVDPNPRFRLRGTPGAGRCREPRERSPGGHGLPRPSNVNICSQ